MKIIFLCLGNICRSPMAERVARKYSQDAGLDLEITSAAVSSEEVGSPLDRRAARVLAEAGYDISRHRAHRITPQEVAEADLIIAAEQSHLDRLRHLEPDPDRLRLINDFNPEKVPGTPLNDPWYGTEEDFYDTLADIEAAMPGIMALAQSQLV